MVATWVKSYGGIIGYGAFYDAMMQHILTVIMNYDPSRGVKFETYCYGVFKRIAENCVRKHYSQEKLLAKYYYAVYDRDEDIELKIAVQQIVQRLTPFQQKICHLLREGYSYREIAEALNTYPMKVAREIKKIREIFHHELYAA